VAIFEKLLTLIDKRLEKVDYALACDNEANHRYMLQPNGWHRFKISVIAFFFE
jgi:hypothetical protein